MKKKKFVERAPVTVSMPVQFFLPEDMTVREFARLMFKLGHEIKPTAGQKMTDRAAISRRGKKL